MKLASKSPTCATTSRITRFAIGCTRKLLCPTCRLRTTSSLASSLLRSKTDAFAHKYVASTTATGRYQHAADMLLLKPTWDMLQGKEVVP
ncbi:hypothetical protein BGZ63DRAFT_150792 [Mariannaea sp. PMI_226]|nr:hypothetical protein BGZ63DRAFT_150792 [Mariannaea sp. PMI_226]